MSPTQPLSNFIDLSGLSHAGEEFVITPNSGQRARLAEWAGIDVVDHFESRVELHKLSSTEFRYHAQVRADIAQSCVVTLEPVRSHLEFEFSRELQLVRTAPRVIAENIAPEPADDNVPELIMDTNYDIAAPLLEEFALAIDPYPRAPGASFRPEPDMEGERESPFAVLKGMKGAR